MPIVLLAALAVIAAYRNFFTPGGDGRNALDVPGGFILCSSPSNSQCVVDGDTIRAGGEKIRIEDYNTPETWRPKCSREAKLGEQAKRRLLELLNAGDVAIVHNGGRDEDRYGRKLRIVLVDGRNVGDTLIREGLAKPYSDPNNREWCGLMD